MSNPELQLALPTEAATEALGHQLAKVIREGVIIYLVGDLGAGKTRLAQAVIHGLGYSGHVKSPTYTMVESYPFGATMIYHFDLYRLLDPMELEYMGIQDYFESGNVILIEWPEKGATMIEQPDISIKLNYLGTGREAVLTSESDRGIEVLSKLKQNL